jgi:hypothetical protein
MQSYRMLELGYMGRPVLGSIAEQSVLILRLEDGQRRPRERERDIKKEIERLDIWDDARTVVAKMIA